MPPVTMTRAQYQATYGAPPQVPIPPVQPTSPDPTPVQMTKSQYQSTYGQAPTPSIPSQIGNNLVDTISQGGKKVASDIANTPVSSNVGTNLLNVLKTGGNVAGDIAGTAGGILGSVISPFLPQGVKNAVGDVSKYVSDKVNAIPGMTPEIAKGLGDVFNTASLIGGAKAETPIKAVVGEGVADIKSTLSDLNPLKKTPVSPGEIDVKLKGVANDWAKPTQEVGNRFNNAKAVIEKDPNVTTTLAKNGVNPFEHIEDGKYNTEGTAQKIRDNNATLSKEKLQPALHMADYYTPRTSIMELKPSVDSSFGKTPLSSEKIQTQIASEMEALGRKYPNGLSLTDTLDEAINFDRNGGYKEYKSNADNIDAVANRSIANSLRTTLATKGEAAGVKVNDFQSSLAKNYRAADYLDALHGKKAPVSPLQSAVRYGAKILGAKTAGMLGGGDLISEFVGYHAGGALERFLENLTNPMRDSFLKEIQLNKPESVGQLEQFMEKFKSNQTTTPQLPPGKALGTEGNPIITPAPTTYENPSQKINRK